VSSPRLESGKHSDRPELEKAIALCKRDKARLIIAKLDRLSRNVAFISALMERKVDFLAVDNPAATKFTIHILAAVAEHERDMIATRVREAFAAGHNRRRKPCEITACWRKYYTPNGPNRTEIDVRTISVAAMRVLGRLRALARRASLGGGRCR
jgi:DNA invertase Pin-like site-specific DNA recombinase